MEDDWLLSIVNDRIRHALKSKKKSLYSIINIDWWFTSFEAYLSNGDSNLNPVRINLFIQPPINL